MRHRVHHREIDRILRQVYDVVGRADRDLLVAGISCRKPCPDTGCWLSEDQLAGPDGDNLGMQRLTAAIVEHGSDGREHLLRNVLGDVPEVDILVPGVGIDGVIGIVPIDPLAHEIPPAVRFGVRLGPERVPRGVGASHLGFSARHCPEPYDGRMSHLFQ